MLSFSELAAVAFAFSRSLKTALSACAKGVGVRLVGATNKAASELLYVVCSGVVGKVLSGVDAVALRTPRYELLEGPKQPYAPPFAPDGSAENFFASAATLIP